MSMKLQEGDLEETREELLFLWKGIVQAWENDSFPAKPGKLCEWCSFKSICPAWNFLSEGEKERGREEGVAMTTVMGMGAAEGGKGGREGGRVVNAGGNGV